MRVYVTRRFDRFAKKHGITDAVLYGRIIQAEQGQIEANLSGCLIKLRIARKGEGKSGGYRTLVAYRKGDLAIYLFGFAKNEMGSISSVEEQVLEEAGAALLGRKDREIAVLVSEGAIREVIQQNG